MVFVRLSLEFDGSLLRVCSGVKERYFSVTLVRSWTCCLTVENWCAFLFGCCRFFHQPRVDAVDFHDPGEEEDGNFDLIEDPVTEETYK